MGAARRCLWPKPIDRRLDQHNRSCAEVFFIGNSSFILPSEFRFRVPLGSGRLTSGSRLRKRHLRSAHPEKIRFIAALFSRDESRLFAEIDGP